MIDKLSHNLLLSIVIPSYNRAEFLDYSLEVHVPLAQKHNIQIFVSDNASTDATREIVDKWNKKYPHIVYNCNNGNIGPDGNFELALKYPNTEYVWLLGDTYRIPEGGIEYILDIAKGTMGYDAIVFNLGEFVKPNVIKTKDYADQNALLYDLGALMTCLSCLVYSRELIKSANFSRYKNSYFMQMGIIFEYIAFHPFVIHWAQSFSVCGLPHPTLKKKNWSYTDDVLEIACRRWSNLVFSLPGSYNLEVKMKCILDFGKVSGLFRYRNLFNLRRLNLLNLKSYREYSRFYPWTIDYPKIFILTISVMPKFVTKALAVMAILFSKKNKPENIKRIFTNEA